ncbi:MAG: ribonuclease III [Planctomycetaceae bacterium]|nr:ribonuclease III [Planctomycetaceae bacterium]
MAPSITETSSLDERLAVCEAILGHPFRDRELLERCLTHASIARTRLESNERLEFLGDAILGALTCELLYDRFPEETEGELTRIKSVVVSRTTCARISEQMGLHHCLMLGKGLSIVDQVPSSVIAAVFESFVAGVYLDGGWDAARTFVRRWVEPEIDRVLLTTHGKNFKSLLQQMAQKALGATPVYVLLDEKGPDHSKCFKVAATVGSETYPGAWGPNKKEAEQRAAENAWCSLQGQPAPYVTED